MVPAKFRLWLCLLATALPRIGNTQIRSTWFDINPSQSNLDAAGSPNGASGGRVHNVASKNDQSLMMAASEWGGLWQSFNQGQTWSRVRTFLPSAPYDVAFAAATTNAPRGTLYVSSQYDGRVNSLSGISISINDGATWTNAPIPPGPCTNINFINPQGQPTAWQISVNPNDPNDVFVGTNCGLARTLNAGATWTYHNPLGPTAGAPQVFAVTAVNNQLVYIATSAGFFFSRDQGNNWTAGAAPSTGFSDLAVSPYENNVLYMAVAGNLFESVDSGLTWPTSITTPSGNGRTGTVHTNRRSAANTYDLWYGGVGLFRETATAQNPPNVGGAQRAPANAWTASFASPAGGHDDCGDLLFAPGTATDACPIIFTSDGGIYRNTNRTSPNCHAPAWEQPNLTPHATWLFGFDGMVGSNNVNQLYYGLQDNGTWGTSFAPTGFSNPWPVWNNEDCCDGFSMGADPGDILYVMGFFGTGRGFRLFRGGEGIPSSTEIPNYPTTAGILTFAPGRSLARLGNNSFAATFGDGVYLTGDITANTIGWTGIGNPTATSTAGGGIKSSRTRTGTSRIFYHTGANGKVYDPGQIFTYTGTAPGGTWTQVNRPPGTVSFTVYDVDPNNDQRIMACALDAANTFTTWFTNNGGANWTAMPALDNLMTGNGIFRNNNATLMPQDFYPAVGQVWQPYMFEINPNNPATVVAGAAEAGIFLTTNFGGNWVRLTNPLAITSLVSTAPHIPRPLFAWFSTTRISNATSAFDVWVGSQGGGVQKFLIESP